MCCWLKHMFGFISYGGDMLDRILVYSPDYLEVIFNESKDYRFCMQGYGNIKDLENGLIRTPSSEILGLIMAFEFNPDQQMLDGIVRLSEFLADAHVKLVVVFVKELIDEHFLYILKEHYKRKRISVKLIHDKEYFTDVTIKRDLLGTVLKSNYKVFQQFRQSDININNFIKPMILSYKLYGNDILGTLLTQVRKLPSEKLTIEQDIVVRRLDQKNLEYFQKKMLEIRKVYIKLIYTEDINYITELQLIADTLDYSQNNVVELLSAINYIKDNWGKGDNLL